MYRQYNAVFIIKLSVSTFRKVLYVYGFKTRVPGKLITNHLDNMDSRIESYEKMVIWPALFDALIDEEILTKIKDEGACILLDKVSIEYTLKII